MSLSHRELWPEQYDHPVVGLEVQHKRFRKQKGIVERVVRLETAKLAYLAGLIDPIEVGQLELTESQKDLLIQVYGHVPEVFREPECSESE